MEKEINLTDFLKIILKRKKFILLLCLIFLFLCTVYNVFATRLYKSEATLIPLDSARDRVFSNLGGSGALQLLSGFVGSIAGHTSTEKFIIILDSKTLAKNVIDSLNLMPKIFPGQWDSKKGKWKNPEKLPGLTEDAISYMQDKVIRVKESKGGLVKLWTLWKDPKLAQKITSQYILELQKFINQNTFSIAKKNRFFLEEQLALKKIELSDAEEKLKTFQEEHKIISLDNQAEMTARTMANLKAEILSRDYRLAMLKNTSGLQSAEAQKTLAEKKELEKQLRKIESGLEEKQTKKGSSSNFTPVDVLSDLMVQYQRLKRNSLILEKVFELLTQQYELAKIEEVKDEVSFQVIDQAQIPTRKYKPRILVNSILSLITGLLIGVVFIIARESFFVAKRPGNS